MDDKSKDEEVTDLVDDIWQLMEAQADQDPLLQILYERLEGSFQLIGITGGIATGKSTFSNYLKESGIPVIDADEIARRLAQPGGKSYEKIVQAFGSDILDETGNIDRKKLAGLVFQDSELKKTLESMTHPPIFEEIVAAIKELKRQGHHMAFVDAALLFESGLHQQMNHNILIKIPEDIQCQRLMTRDQLSEEDAWLRIRSQMPVSEKEKLADTILDNSGSFEELKQQCLNFLTGDVTNPIPQK